jgi:hypothetical protein
LDQITPGMMYGLAALSLAIYAIPLLIVAYLVIKQAIKAPIRTWVPPAGFFRSVFAAARRQRTDWP